MGIIRYSLVPWIVTSVLRVSVSANYDGTSMLPPSSAPRRRSLRKGFLSESSIYNHHETILEKNRTKSIEQSWSNTDEIRGRHLDDNGGGCDRYLQTELSDTIGSYGQMFNIRPKEDRITITGFEFYTDLTGQWGNLNYFLFSREGTYQTAQSDLTKWSLVANGTVAGMGKGNPTPIPETLALPVFPGGVRAFYFTLTRADLRYRYGNGDKGDEEIQIANNDFEIYEGIGVLSFPVKRDFSEGSREFLGGIRYKTFSPCDANDPDQDDPTILTTVVSLTFFIEHSNRLNLLSLVTQTNQNVEATLQNLLSSSAGLASYADSYDMQLDKVESFLLQADENAPPCITTEAALTCSVVEAIVTSKHNDEIDTDLVKKIIMDQGEPISANMNYKALYIGLSYLDTTKILTLVGTQGTMDTNSISIFESQMLVFLKPFLENDGIDIKKVVVKDQTFVPNSQLRHGNIFAPDNRLRNLQKEYGRNTVTFLVIAEYNAPPKKVISGIVDQSIEASGENFILAARGKPGGQYFNDVYLTNPIDDLEESNENEEDDDSNNDDDSGGGGESGSSAGMIIGILGCFLVVAGGGFWYYRRRTAEVEEKLALIKSKFNERVAKTRESTRHEKSDERSLNEKRKSDDKRRRSRRRSSRHRRKSGADSDDEAHNSNRRRRGRRRGSGRRRSEKRSDSESENEDKNSSSRRHRSSTKPESSGDKGEKENDKRRRSKQEKSERRPSQSPDRGRASSDSKAKASQDDSKHSSRNAKMKKRDSSPDKSVGSHSTTSPETSSGRNGEEISDRKPPNAEPSEVSENMSSHHRSNRPDNNNTNTTTPHILLEESSSDENADDEQQFDAPPEEDTLRRTKERRLSTGKDNSDKSLKASTDRGPIRDRIKDFETEDNSDRRRSSASRPDRAFQSEHRRTSRLNSSEHRRSTKKDTDHSQHPKSNGVRSEHRRSNNQRPSGRVIQSDHLRRSTATFDDEDNHKKDSENSEEDTNVSSRHRRASSATLRRASSARHGHSEHARRSNGARNDRMYNSEHRRSTTTTKPEMTKMEDDKSFEEGGNERMDKLGSDKKEDSGTTSDVDEKKNTEEVLEEKEEDRSDDKNSVDDGSSSQINDEKEGEPQQQQEEESTSRRRSESRPRGGVDTSSSSRRPRGTSRSRPPESDRRRSSRGVSRQRRTSSSRPDAESDVEGDHRKDRTRRTSDVSSRRRRTSATRNGGGESDKEGGGDHRQPGRRNSNATDSRRRRATRRASQNGGGGGGGDNDGESKGSKSSNNEQPKESQARNRRSRPSLSSSEVQTRGSSERIQAHRRRKRDLERRRHQERRNENS